MGDTLDGVLLGGILSEFAKGDAEVWNIKRFVTAHLALVLGALLVILGFVGIRWCPGELGKRFSDALLIAGILSVVVDFPLKRKLQEDTARDIFHHLMGITLPFELRDSLQKFVVDNAVYQENVVYRIHIGPKGRESGVLIHVSIDANVVAAADAPYSQQVQTHDALQFKLLKASLRTEDKVIYASESNELAMVAHSKERWVSVWKGAVQHLNRGDKLTRHLEYTVERPENDGYHLFFGYPAIHPRLRLTWSVEFEADASEPTFVNGNEYLYNRVFLKGDNIQVRWRRKSSQ